MPSREGIIVPKPIACVTRVPPKKYQTLNSRRGIKAKNNVNIKVPTKPVNKVPPVKPFAIIKGSALSFILKVFYKPHISRKPLYTTIKKGYKISFGYANLKRDNN